jgi:hypothetical protein
VTSGRDSAGPPPHREDAVHGAPVPQPGSASVEEGTEVHDLSQQEYVHTTTGTPDHTALIPAIKDDLADVKVPEASEGHAAEAKPTTPAPAPAPEPSPPLVVGRTAGLRLVRVEPYSVTRLAFVVSVALMIVSVVAVAIFWIMLAVTGVWGQINDSVASLLSDDTASFDIRNYLGFGRVVGGTLVLSGINVILMTALATVGAHLYNLAAALLGGVEATFADD